MKTAGYAHSVDQTAMMGGLWGVYQNAYTQANTQSQVGNIMPSTIMWVRHKYLHSKRKLNSFPQGQFSGSGLMSLDWAFTLLVSALQPHATRPIIPLSVTKRPTGRQQVGGATESPTERVGL